MNPFTPSEWIERESQRKAHLVRIAADHPLIDDNELRERCRRAAHLAMIQDGTLADRMRKLPEGKFCGWAGLNPHLVAEGEDEPRCRACQRNDTCTQPFKVGGW